jgi:hypothetical protein
MNLEGPAVPTLDLLMNLELTTIISLKEFV